MGGSANATICAERISDETLSAWRDDLLSPVETARLRAHTPSCGACQARLSDYDTMAMALLRQRELEPGERIVEGVRQRAARGGRRRGKLGPGGNRRLWSGLGALGSVAAVLLLFVYVFSQSAGKQGGNPQATASTFAFATATATPGKHVVTPPPTVTPSGPFSQVVSIQTAWGPNAAKQSLTTQVDATHLFWANGISPDGRSLLGYEYTVSGGSPDLSAPAQAGLLDTASRHFTGIGVSSNAGYPPGCCMDDGRYLIATDSTAPGATCGICNTRYWSYDTQTGALWQVAVGGQYQGIERAYEDHGLLIFGSSTGIWEAGLAARHINPLAGVPSTAMLQLYSWPYVFYSDNSAPEAVLVRDLSTGTSTALPQQAAALGGQSAAQNGAMVLTGDTLFLSTVSQDNQVTTLYEMDHFLSSGAQLHELGRYPGSASVVAANDRLVNFGGVFWDRLEHVFVSDGQAPNGALVGPGALLAGTYLATFQLNGGVPESATSQQVTIYDTAALPEQIIP